MAARQKGSFSLGGTLEILADAPADARLCVKTKSELTDASSYPYKYVGMIVSVADEGKAYILTAADTTIASNWKELGEGGGGGGGTAGSVYTGTLLASGWNSTTKQQTLTFTSYDASYNGVIGLPADATAAQMEEYRNCLIRTVSQSGATVTFECEEIPSINLPVEIYCGGGSGSGVPAGGTTGQALVKKSNTDGDVEWKDVGNSVFEIHFANNAVDVTYSQLGEALSANKILKLIDTENDVVLAFTGYYSGAYYFSTICMNRRQEMVNTSIVLYQSAPSSDVVATQVQRLTLTEDVQKTEMPTADSTYLNKIYQYIGTTDANFTNGLFYRCVNTSGTYTWQECETQHRLTPSEMADIMSTLPGAPTQYPKYSTTEQVVGEWIDGKPLYQKTIFSKTPTQHDTEITTTVSSVSNIALIVDYKAIACYTSFYDGYLLPGIDLHLDSPNRLAWAFWLGKDSSNILVLHQKLSATDSAWDDMDIIITLQYTKTTD